MNAMRTTNQTFINHVRELSEVYAVSAPELNAMLGQCADRLEELEKTNENMLLSAESLQRTLDGAIRTMEDRIRRMEDLQRRFVWLEELQCRTARERDDALRELKKETK